jgi:hypothetical protein
VAVAGELAAAPDPADTVALRLFLRAFLGVVWAGEQPVSWTTNIASGYVYILINTSLDGMIKVGRTTRDPQERARELSRATGIPTPFRVAYECFVSDCEQVEGELHARLFDYRVSKDREFFRYPLHLGIKLLEELQTGHRRPTVDDFSAIDITGQPKARHPSWIRDDLTSIRLVQTSERVYMETTEEELIAGYLKDQTIRRQDLAFIVDGEEEGVMFDPNNSVEINAKKFVDDMDPWSLLHCCVEILTEDAVKIIQERHNPHKII